MSPVIKRRHCRGCGRAVDPNLTCTHCGTPHGRAQDAARTKASGRNTVAWKRLRIAAIAAHPYCALCASRDDLTGDHLRYPARTLADVRVLCRSCNGRLGQAKGELAR